jgi:predicted O-methyltransferase YrrM
MAIDQAFVELGKPFTDLLRSMYEGAPQIGADRKPHPIDTQTRISPEQGMWIYRLCRAAKPKDVLEVGLAFGFSTVYLLAAIRANGIGSHIAIDPFQTRSWAGIGTARARLLGMEDAFTVTEETSPAYLSRMHAEGRRFDLIFIDGNHRFDDVLVDFILSAQVLRPGGHMLLDDTWMPSIKKVVSFIRSNRPDFVEVGPECKKAIAFKKIGEDQRKWDHFVDF